MTETLLEMAERRDLPLLIERLKLWPADEDISDVIELIGDDQGPPFDPEEDDLDDLKIPKIVTDLMLEALWYAERGDADEAILRIRCLERPKYDSERKCRRAYKTAMAEQQARSA